MNWRAILAIVRKDVQIVVQSKGVLIPLIIVPFTLTVALPGMMAALPRLANIADVPAAIGIEEWIARLPQGVQQNLAIYNTEQRLVVLMVVYYLAPMFLILPLMFASVIAADSVAGEKERKSLEALLYTPTTDLELFIAKLLAAWLPATSVALGGFVVYSLVTNLAAWPVMGEIFFPNTMWVILALWVAPAVAGLGLSATVIVSTRVNTFQEAYQVGGVVVIPIVVLIVTQATGAIYFSSRLVFYLGLILWLVDLTLIWIGGRLFRRSHLALQI